MGLGALLAEGLDVGVARAVLGARRADERLRGGDGEARRGRPGAAREGDVDLVAQREDVALRRGQLARRALADQVAEEAGEALVRVHLRRGLRAARPLGRERHVAARLVVAEVAELPRRGERVEHLLHAPRKVARDGADVVLEHEHPVVRARRRRLRREPLPRAAVRERAADPAKRQVWREGARLAADRRHVLVGRPARLLRRLLVHDAPVDELVPAERAAVDGRHLLHAHAVPVERLHRLEPIGAAVEVDHEHQPVRRVDRRLGRRRRQRQ